MIPIGSWICLTALFPRGWPSRNKLACFKSLAMSLFGRSRSCHPMIASPLQNSIGAPQSLHHMLTSILPAPRKDRRRELVATWCSSLAWCSPELSSNANAIEEIEDADGAVYLDVHGAASRGANRGAAASQPGEGRKITGAACFHVNVHCVRSVSCLL